MKGAYDVIYVENEYSVLDREEPTTPYGETTSECLAYVIYTSGSTGQPKGVMVTHSNVISLFQVTPSLYSFNEKDVWTLFHSYAFDFSVWEIWGALLYGGRLVVVPYTTSRSPEAFYHLLCTEYVTVLNQTPSAFRQLMLVDQAEEKRVTLPLRLIIFGGETLNFQSLQPWFERHSEHNPQLVNMYGITETTVLNTYKHVTFKDVIENKGSVIGEPLSNTYIYLLDQDLQKVASGIPGELYVGGACVSRGYVNREDLTQKCFIRDPFSISSSARLYRSGDIARYLDDGTLEYLGRIDNQVKIRGFRVELEEIEILLAGHTHIREVVVLVHEDMLAEKRLVAYITTDNALTTVSDLRISLKQKLPEYMIPSLFMFLDSFPLTVNGKIDRQALPIPDWSLREHEVIPATPCNPTEERLMSIWSQVLGLDQIDIHDDFFDLGGDSLSAIYTVSLIRKTLKVPVEHHLFFDAPTIAEQAEVIIKMRVDDLNT